MYKVVSVYDQKIMKKFYTFIMAITTGIVVSAQANQDLATNTVIPDVKPEQTTKTTESAWSTGWGVGLNLSTNGIGLEVSKSFLENLLAVRAQGTYMSVSMKDYELAIDVQKALIDVDATNGYMGLMLDYHPFRNAFRLTVGGAYMLTEVNTSIRLKDGLVQGGITVPAEKIGKVTADLSYNNIAPYFGIGFGRAVPKKRIGFGFEMGTFYVGAPTLDFKATGLLEPTSTQGTTIQENLKDYACLPQLTFNITFRIL
jgi:hypothetical protein